MDITKKKQEVEAEFKTLAEQVRLANIRLTELQGAYKLLLKEEEDANAVPNKEEEEEKKEEVTE